MRIVYTLLFLCFASFSIAQNSYQFGLLPTINLNKKLENDWQLNLKSEFRQILEEGLFKEDNTFNYQYIQTDASIIASKKTGLNNKLAGGFLLRFKEKESIKRSIQQFTIINRVRSFRFGHRFAADQTFGKNQDTEFRFRYRITFDLPLNGEDVDAKEWYLKFGNEYLNSLQSQNYDLEIRATPTLGYVFTDNNKLEFGLDYRIDSFINGDSRQRFWLVVNWYLRI